MKEQIQLGYPKPALPKQKRFHNSKAKFRAYIGGVGSGKTICGCMEALIQSSKSRNNLGLIGAPTYRQLKDTTQRTLFDILDEAGCQKLYDYRASEEKLIWKPTGSEILFRSLEEFDRFKSLNLGWFFMDEGNDAPEECFLMLQSRLRRVGADLRGWICSNPAGHDYVWKRFDQSDSPNYQLFKAPSTENVYLPEGYIESMLESYPEQWIQRFIYGEFTAFEGQIFTAFAREHNVIEPMEIPDWWTRFEAIDVGMVHPTGILFGAEDKEGNLYIYDEHRQSNMIVDDIAKVIKKKRAGIAPDSTVIDYSSSKTEQTSGENVRGMLEEQDIYANDSNKDWRASIQRINLWLKQGKLYIFSSCTSLVEEIEQYQYEKPRMHNGVMMNTDRPRKWKDDLVDCLRYMVMDRPDYQTPVKPVRRPVLRDGALTLSDVTRMVDDAYYEKKFDDEWE